jgi:amidohydrolase
MLRLLGRVALSFAVAMAASRSGAADPDAWAEKNLGDIVELYKHFHAHPELSLHEKETAAQLAEEWKKVGLEVTTDFGGHGVVGILKNGNGPTVMFRADMDALPVVEKTGLVFASTVTAPDGQGGKTGVMHACGHDVHITNAVAAARYMAENKDRWSGTLMFIGQPAEERGMGAQMMLDAGLFTKFPKPDFGVALHCDSLVETGGIGVCPGFMLANVDSVDITLIGRGGHGAHPYATIDPIVMAAHLVVDLQSIVAREMKPGVPAVVTVGSIHGGTKHNIIGDTCKLQLTVRSFTEEVREKLLKAIERKAKAAAAAAGAPEPKIEYSDKTPATFNDAKLTERLANTFRKALGEKKVVNVEPSMGAEDFSLYGRAGVPCCMYRLGVVEAQRMAGYKRVGQLPPGLHSPQFHPDAEPTLRTGIIATCSALLDLLPKAADAK